METKATEITARALKQKIQNNEDVILIDALSPESFCAHHIPGSINIPENKLQEFAELVLPDKDQEVIVYCKNRECKASGRAAEILANLGYTNVIHYAGGLEGWKQDGFDLVESGEEAKNEKC